jgi:hypothetical protein
MEARHPMKELYAEIKTNTGIAQAIAIGFMWTLLFLIWHELLKAAELRNFFLVEVGCVVVMILVLAFQYKNLLGKGEDGVKDPQVDQDRMKFQAEIFAGIAFVSFFLSFYRLGIELDQINLDGRVNRLKNAEHYLGEVGKCKTNLTLKQTCGDLEADFRAARGDIYMENEGLAKAAVQKVRSEAAQVVGSNPAKTLKRFDEELDAALVKQDTKLFSFITLSITLFFSALAISRKVALAWPKHQASESALADTVK